MTIELFGQSYWALCWWPQGFQAQAFTLQSLLTKFLCVLQPTVWNLCSGFSAACVSSDDDLKGYLRFVLMSWRHNDQPMCISSLSNLLATTGQSVIEFLSLLKCFMKQQLQPWDCFVFWDCGSWYDVGIFTRAVSRAI